MNELATDTVVVITEDQYEEIIQSLHTLTVTTENAVGALSALFAVLIIFCVIMVLWNTIRSITQYF